MRIIALGSGTTILLSAIYTYICTYYTRGYAHSGLWNAT